MWSCIKPVCEGYVFLTLMHYFKAMLNFLRIYRPPEVTSDLSSFPTPSSFWSLTFRNVIWDSQIAVWNSIPLGNGTTALSRAVTHTAVFDGNLTTVQDDILADRSLTRVCFFYSYKDTHCNGAKQLLMWKALHHHYVLNILAEPQIRDCTLPIPGQSLTFDPALSRHGGTGGGESCRAALKPSV